MTATVAPTWGTLQDAAEAFQISEKTLRRWISEGRVDARRFGPRLIRVNMTSIESMGTPLQYIAGAA